MREMIAEGPADWPIQQVDASSCSNRRSSARISWRKHRRRLIRRGARSRRRQLASS